MTIYGDTNNLEICEKYEVLQTIDYKSFIKNITLQNEKRIAPLYIKKPNLS
jgi:hypothetical protein